MKKLLMTGVVALFLLGSAYYVMAVKTVTLLSAVSATGAGSAYTPVDFKWQSAGSLMMRAFTVDITTTSAATAVTMSLEGSIDNTTWHTLGSHTMSAGELTASKAMFHVVNKPVSYVRANMTTFTQAASETVTVKAVASP